MKTINVDDRTFVDFRATKTEIMLQLKEQLSDTEALALILAAVSQYKESFFVLNQARIK
jgi:hypothetical protein